MWMLARESQLNCIERGKRVRENFLSTAKEPTSFQLNFKIVLDIVENRNTIVVKWFKRGVWKSAAAKKRRDKNQQVNHPSGDRYGVRRHWKGVEEVSVYVCRMWLFIEPFSRESKTTSTIVLGRILTVHSAFHTRQWQTSLEQLLLLFY